MAEGLIRAIRFTPPASNNPSLLPARLMYQAGSTPARVLVRNTNPLFNMFLGFNQTDFVDTSGGTVPEYVYQIGTTAVFILAPFQQLYGAAGGTSQTLGMAASQAVELSDIGKYGRATDSTSRFRRVSLTVGRQPLALAVAPDDSVVRVTVRVPEGNVALPNVPGIRISNDFNVLLNEPTTAYFLPSLNAVEGGSQRDTFVLAPGEKLYGTAVINDVEVSVFKTLFSDVFSPIDVAKMSERERIAKALHFSF